MTVSRRTLLATLAAAPATALLPKDLFAAGYPDRPIHLIVPFAAGGNADIVGRLAGDQGALGGRFGTCLLLILPFGPILIAPFGLAPRSIAIDHQHVGGAVEIGQRVGDRSVHTARHLDPQILDQILRRIARATRRQKADELVAIGEEDGLDPGGRHGIDRTKRAEGRSFSRTLRP